MISVRDEASFSRALKRLTDKQMVDLLRERRRQLGIDIDLTDLVHFLLVQPNDHLSSIEGALGFSILTNHVDGSQFGATNFSPSTEWIADHGFCFEAVFIFDDSGFAHVLIVPRQSGVDAQLIAFCEQFSLTTA